MRLRQRLILRCRRRQWLRTSEYVTEPGSCCPQCSAFVHQAHHHSHRRKDCPPELMTGDSVNSKEKRRSSDVAHEMTAECANAIRTRTRNVLHFPCKSLLLMSRGARFEFLLTRCHSGVESGNGFPHRSHRSDR